MTISHHLSCKLLSLIPIASQNIAFRSLALETSKDGWLSELMRIGSLVSSTVASFFLWRINLLRLATCNINLWPLRRVMTTPGIQAASLRSLPVAVFAWVECGCIHALLFIHQLLLYFICFHHINGGLLLGSVLRAWLCTFGIWLAFTPNITSWLFWSVRSLLDARTTLTRRLSTLVGLVCSSIHLLLIFNLLQLLRRCKVEVVYDISDIGNGLSAIGLLSSLSLSYFLLWVLRLAWCLSLSGGPPRDPWINQRCLLININWMIFEMIAASFGFDVLVELSVLFWGHIGRLVKSKFIDETTSSHRRFLVGRRFLTHVGISVLLWWRIVLSQLLLNNHVSLWTFVCWTLRSLQGD